MPKVPQVVVKIKISQTTYLCEHDIINKMMADCRFGWIQAVNFRLVTYDKIGIHALP